MFAVVWDDHCLPADCISTLDRPTAEVDLDFVSDFHK